MTLQEQIKKDLMLAMKEKDEEKKGALRIIIGEFARAENKTLSDDEVIRVIKKLIKSERETMGHAGVQEDSRYIEILEAYTPQAATDAEIRQWIDANVDFSQYKNKMMAMRDILAHFGSRADGNRVKEILQSM